MESLSLEIGTHDNVCKADLTEGAVVVDHL
jgi:hypothetical protein